MLAGKGARHVVVSVGTPSVTNISLGLICRIVVGALPRRPKGHASAEKLSLCSWRHEAAVSGTFCWGFEECAEKKRWTAIRSGCR